MRHIIGEIEFKANIILESEETSRVIELGPANNTMRLYREDKGRLLIHWMYMLHDAPFARTEANITVYVNGREVVAYEGVITLPQEAIKLLNKSGFYVSDNVTENEYSDSL